MKPEWGSKHECPSCRAHFYDMRKPDAACPKCNTPVNDKAALIAKKGDLNKASAKPKPKRDPLEDFDDLDDDIDLDLDDAEDDFLEDTDDLGGDDENDMSEIMEHIDDDSGETNL